MRTSGRRLVFAALLLACGLAVLAPPALAQCSMCRQVIAQSPEAQRVGAELNRAILLMFLAPYLVFTSFALVLFRVPIAERLRRVVRVFLLPR
ncbi:MAG TPA: hypothetical protein VI669_03495 [Vicinamibacteria bacterium]